MISQITITNHNSLPVVFRGTGFYIYIPGNAVELEAQIPNEDAQENIQYLRLEHPYLTIDEVGVAEGIPTNDLLYLAPSYFEDENYKGVWDASAGADPHGSPETGWYWRVSVPGSHPLDGIASWAAGDHVRWNGERWIKIVTWIQDHANLSCFQGGISGERYHLTAAQYAMVVAQGQTLSPNSDPTFRNVTVESIDFPDGGLSRVIAVPTQSVDTGETVVDSIPDANAKGAVWRYVVDNGDGTNMRTGKMQACWDREADGNVAPFPDKSGPDIGSTDGIEFSVEKDGNTVQLKCTAGSDGWAIDLTREMIG